MKPDAQKPGGLAARIRNFTKRFLSHRHLPWFLAIGAILVMLPAVKTDLMLDDLLQRVVELKPDQLPARLREAGIPPDTGSLGTVLRDLFPGLTLDPQSTELGKRYGMLPWWLADDLRPRLWRPLTAFTHWLDYRLYPDSPALMHLHNIAWFAAIVGLVTILYRKLMGPGWAAGLAALLFLLDSNTYFPVAFVANRGFMLSLFLGLMCLHQHHRWRAAGSRFGGWLSALFLALALFANEGGASTLAFILAYALVLEPGSWRRRALTVLPAIAVIVLWRTAYNLSGFGVQHLSIYIDPTNEPLEYARVVFPRILALLGGQLAGVVPELPMVFKSSLQPILIALFGAVVLAALAVFLPWVRRNKTAAFWFVVMLLAVVPAATVVPLSKNLGFVAVGAYGLIASFVAARFPGADPAPSAIPDGRAEYCLPGGWAYRSLAGIACGLLLLAHVPGAMVGRVLTAVIFPQIGSRSTEFSDIGNLPDVENKNVIILNAPLGLVTLHVPANRAYHHLPLPKTLRVLAPSTTTLEVLRTDDRTLEIRSRAANFFVCDDVGAVHGAYLCQMINRLWSQPRFKRGERHELGNLTVEVLEVDAESLPSRVAYRFDAPLESPGFHWLYFDRRTFCNQPFPVPPVGQSVTLPGPHR